MKNLEIENLSVSYDGRKDAVHNVSLSIGEGEIVSIVGESGSGKSTLLHAALGLLPQSCMMHADRMDFLGESLLKTCSTPEKTAASAYAARISKLRGEQISMIFQNAGRYMNPTQTIGKQYRTFLKYHGNPSKAECKAMASQMFRKLGLEDPERIWNAYPFELSGGMCQRAAIAMAMTRRPKLLLADEPTSALDVTVQAQVIRQLLALREEYGTAILLVTHNMGAAAFISDRIGVMKDGEMIEQGDARTVIEHPRCSYTRNLLHAVIEPEDPRFVR